MQSRRSVVFFFFQAEDGIRDYKVTGVQTCALPISALTPAPAPPVTLEEKQHVTRLLLAAGATIGELNAVRKHLSRFKGGLLADRKSTRLNSSHLVISYAVFCLKKKINQANETTDS